MSVGLAGLDLSEAVEYHYGRFPPSFGDSRLIKPLARASAAIARYDQMLRSMHNSELLLAPLRNREAVVSSRMEGTISTLDEVLRYEADQEDGDDTPPTLAYRNETIEVALYSRAMRSAQIKIKEGYPLSDWLIRSAHKQLLNFGRGAALSPGEYKTDQNYLADRGRRKVLFVPIKPEFLQDGLDKLFAYIEADEEILIRTAVAHLEFEALHPFKDGNGRIGRMIIPLMLWKGGVLSEPHFYVSSALEEHRDEYIDRMRDVSKDNSWTEWVVFFLDALERQAQQNLSRAEEIRLLYEEMKTTFRGELSSQWATVVQDFMFTRPVFKNNIFTSRSGIPPATAHRFTRTLVERGLLATISPASGRRPAMYAFEPLLKLVRT
jgi:Fic family protein